MAAHGATRSRINNRNKRIERAARAHTRHRIMRAPIRITTHISALPPVPHRHNAALRVARSVRALGVAAMAS